MISLRQSRTVRTVGKREWNRCGRGRQRRLSKRQDRNNCRRSNRITASGFEYDVAGNQTKALAPAGMGVTPYPANSKRARRPSERLGTGGYFFQFERFFGGSKVISLVEEKRKKFATRVLSVAHLTIYAISAILLCGSGSLKTERGILLGLNLANGVRI